VKNISDVDEIMAILMAGRVSHDRKRRFPGTGQSFLHGTFPIVLEPEDTKKAVRTRNF
jgi:hypothetical protein